MDENKNRLIAVLNRCRTPQDYADSALELLGNPLVVFDANMCVVGISDCDAVDENYKKLQQERFPGPELRDDLEWQKKMRRRLAEEMVREEFVYDRVHLSKVLRVGGTVVGQLDVCAALRDFTEQDREIFEMMCTSCSVRLFNQLSMQPRRRDRLDYLLEYLLDGNELTEEKLGVQIALSDWRPGNSLYILAADAFGSGAESVGIPLREIMGPEDKALHYKKYLIVILSRAQGIDCKGMAELLQKSDICCGLSGAFGSLSELKLYFEQAAAALDIGHRVDPDKWLYRHSDYLFYRPIHDLVAAADVLVYVMPELLALAETPSARQLGLMRTLLSYLNNGRSVQLTAEDLHLHRNTVNYRISRVFEELGLETDDSRRMDQLLLSIRILEYVNKQYYFP